MKTNKKINVLSLFDGISGAKVALDRLNIECNYYASEIDNYALKIANKNYPDTLQLGDITNIKYKNDILYNNEHQYETQIDLIIGGSPCQGFSFAGKQLNFDDPRSKLFFEFVRLIKECKPKYFLLENVRMKKEYQDIISKELGCEPIFINSALVSAQSRKRLYWTNIPNVTQPKDKQIYLKDIIEYGAEDRDKSLCIDANYFKGGNLVQYFEKHRWQLVFDKPIQVAHINQGRQGERVYSIKGKSVTISALGGGWGAKTGLIACVSERGRRLVEDGSKRDDKNGKIVRGYEVVSKDKTNCLTNVEKDNYLVEDLIIRKLTPIECERLQTLPDNYTEGISNTQRYKCLGNSFTVDIIAHILSFAKFE